MEIEYNCWRNFMKSTYVDIHIHTSENPNELNNSYNVKELLKNINKMAKKQSSSYFPNRS